MQVKGNIGDKVLVEGTIDKIMIEEGRVQYSVHVDEAGFNFWADEDKIGWSCEDAVEQNPESVSACDSCRYFDKDSFEEPCMGCNHNYINRWEPQEKCEKLEETTTAEEEFPEEYQPEVKRGRGRPRKATVESLMAKAEQIRIKRENEQEGDE